MKMIRLKQVSFMLFFLHLVCLPVGSQVLSGTVTDAETGDPLEAAMVSLVQGEKIVDYVLTDVKGQFELSYKYNGNLQLSVLLLGYRKEIYNIHSAGTVSFSLYPEAIALKEVLIRPGRISSHKDTIRYDLSRFASDKDVYIKDVLKKLPGIDVDDNGQVKYKGKAIDHYFVEGMDVTGGRYSQINNNLNAKAVKSAEIMENYQSVKALKEKINSEEVALNLKLDPKARDQWMINAILGSGWSDGTCGSTALWEGSANALQLGKGEQSIYSYKTNNNGVDLGKEQNVLIPDVAQTITLSTFLSQPGISVPLDKQRLLFNETHTANMNRMYKWNDERSLRLQAGYTHNLLQQQQSNTTIYYQPNETLRINEFYHYRLINNIGYAEALYEDNAVQHYISNRFSLEGEINRSASQELPQNMHTGLLKAKNSFNLVQNLESVTREFQSVVQYTYVPASLLLSGGENKYQQQSLYTDNSISCLRKYNGFTQQYRAGIQGEWNDSFIETGDFSFSMNEWNGRKSFCDASNVSAYASPYFMLERDKWLSTLTTPIKLKHYFSQQSSFVVFNPSFYMRYRLDYHWKFSVYASIKRSAGDVLDLCPFIYQADYRTWYANNGVMPVNTTQNYQLYGEYTNAVQEFFVTASLNYQHTHSNVLYEQNVSHDTICYIRRKCPNDAMCWTINSTLSKGIYDWNLKTSLTFSMGRSIGQQLTSFSSKQEAALLQLYRYDYLKAEPKIVWSPAGFFDVEYDATLGYSSSKIGDGTHLIPILNFVQRVHFTFSFGNVNLILSGEHYRNDLKDGTCLTTFLADVSAGYKVKKWRLEASFNNLFNKKEYAYTVYSATQSYMSRLSIRPLEIMVKISYQFF